MIWQRYATADVLKGFSVRISDPNHISGPITAYAVGTEDLLAATQDYAATTTDRVQRQCGINTHGELFRTKR